MGALCQQEIMDSGEVEIRRIAPGDLNAVAVVYLESAKHHYSIDPERYVLPEWAEILARIEERLRASEAGESVTLIAVLAGEVVGFIDAVLDRSEDLMHQDILYCRAMELAVAPGYRSRGIGKLLLLAAEDWGREQGAEFALLEHLAGNTRAGAFYEQRMGYRQGSITMVKPLRKAKA